MAEADRAPDPFGTCGRTAQERPTDPWDRQRVVAFSAKRTAAERAKSSKACCYSWYVPCPGGRAYRAESGEAVVAALSSRDDWMVEVGRAETAGLAPGDRESLAQQWSREASFEHASVASFSQLALDLLAVGAPADMVAACLRAALDEVDHASRAFTLASRYAQKPIGPGALDRRLRQPLPLAALAVTTFEDGCIGESLASVVLAERARETSDPVLREMLATTANDEERHAELAWRIVAGTLSVGGEEVSVALTRARDDVATELASGRSTWSSEARGDVLRHIVLPCIDRALEAGSKRRSVVV